jgi:hypothetical protein
LTVAVLVVASGAIAVTQARASAARGTYHVTLPDLEIAVPTGLIGIGPDPNTGDPDLQFSHITWDAGAGPFELKPKYNKHTGTATFSQVIFKSRGGTSWRKGYSVALGGPRGLFISGEAHYRYPLTSFTLFLKNPDGSLTQVAKSPKTDYCIQGDVQVGGVPNTPNNDFIPQSDCNHPSAALGWSVGWGDQYDQTDPGQPIDLTGLPTNQTYLLHAMVDPEGLFTESNKSDNVTDTVLSISNTDSSTVVDDNSTVQVISQTGPVNPLGNMTIMRPTANSTVKGTVTLSATLHPVRARTVKSVQYLLDGEPLGAPVTAAPFTYAWTVGDAARGSHALSAQATDSAGAVMTAPVRAVTVHVSSNAVGTQDPPPTVSVVNPAPGQTVSGTAPVAAAAADDVGIRSVQFELDGHALGAPVTTAPYATSWNTGSVANGGHTLTARATNDSGKVTTSAAVAVTVQNPAPPMACYVLEREVTANGRGSVTTRPFPIAFTGENLLAFVSAIGGEGHGQRAAVRGGGLRWRLVRASNARSGDVEIWTAKAPTTTPAMTVTSSLSQQGHSQHLTVLALEGGAGVGASATASGSSGSPRLQLKTNGAASLVYVLVQGAGVGSRHVPFGWLPLPGAVASGGQASFVQVTNQATGAAGTVVHADDRGAATPWNSVAVELLNEG